MAIYATPSNRHISWQDFCRGICTNTKSDYKLNCLYSWKTVKLSRSLTITLLSVCLLLNSLILHISNTPLSKPYIKMAVSLSCPSIMRYIRLNVIRLGTVHLLSGQVGWDFYVWALRNCCPHIVLLQSGLHSRSYQNAPPQYSVQPFLCT